MTPHRNCRLPRDAHDRPRGDTWFCGVCGFEWQVRKHDAGDVCGCWWVCIDPRHALLSEYTEPSC